MAALPTGVLDVLTSPLEAAGWSARQRRSGARVGFVPTMGALHEGHLALVAVARRECERVAVSIFVNPLQFNNKEDLARYPRQPDQDRRLLEAAGCDMIFLPENEGIYAGSIPRNYELDGLDGLWEGASRPGHFQGMINVVERLFHYVRPDVAFFGEKDRQQLTIVRHVAQQQHWPVRIIGLPTSRAADGLALSSRNQRLSPEERIRATVLYRALIAVGEQAFRVPVEAARQRGLEVLATEPQILLDYLSIAHPGTLRPLTDWSGTDEAVALIAAQVGPVRLIDNITLRR